MECVLERRLINRTAVCYQLVHFSGSRPTTWLPTAVGLIQPRTHAIIFLAKVKASSRVGFLKPGVRGTLLRARTSHHPVRGTTYREVLRYRG
jgi:hypothetical protein